MKQLAIIPLDRLYQIFPVTSYIRGKREREREREKTHSHFPYDRNCMSKAQHLCIRFYLGSPD